jgi:hypothetical protein
MQAAGKQNRAGETVKEKRARRKGQGCKVEIAAVQASYIVDHFAGACAAWQAAKSGSPAPHWVRHVLILPAEDTM